MRLINVNWFLLIAIQHLKVGLKSALIYNVRTLFNLLNGIIILVLQISVWTFLTQSNEVENYSGSSIVTYFVCMYFIGIFLSPQFDIWISRQIYTGDIVLDLSKPILFITYKPFELLGLALYRSLLTGIPMVLILIIFYNLNVTFVNILKILPLLFVSFVFVVSIEFCLGCLSFFTKAYWGIASFKNALLMLLTGRLLPLEFYPTWLNDIINKNPFSIAYYHIVKGITGVESGAYILKLTLSQIGFTIFFVLLGINIWKSSLRKISIQGG